MSFNEELTNLYKVANLGGEYVSIYWAIHRE